MSKCAITPPQEHKPDTVPKGLAGILGDNHNQ